MGHKKPLAAEYKHVYTRNTFLARKSKSQLNLPINFNTSHEQFYYSLQRSNFDPNALHFLLPLQLYLGQLKAQRSSSLTPDPKNPPLLIWGRDESLGCWQQYPRSVCYDPSINSVAQGGTKCHCLRQHWTASLFPPFSQFLCAFWVQRWGPYGFQHYCFPPMNRSILSTQWCRYPWA